MANTKNATIRYQAIDRCLSNRGRNWFIEDILEKCNEALEAFNGPGSGIRKRQLYDDLRVIEGEEGYKAEIERIQIGKKIAYRYSDPSFSINKADLTEVELSQIKDTISILSRFEGVEQLEWIEELLVTLEDRFKIKGRERKIIGYDSNSEYEGKARIRPIFNALINKRALEITYQSFKAKDANTFIFHPHYLKQYNNRWWTFGKRQDSNHYPLNLALDRIRSINEVEDIYEDSDLNWEEYFEDMIGVSKDTEKTIPLKLIFSQEQKPYVLTKPLFPYQRNKELKNGELEVSMDVHHNIELEMRILSYGEGVRVIQPHWFKNRIKKRLKEAFSNYKL